MRGMQITQMPTAKKSSSADSGIGLNDDDISPNAADEDVFYEDEDEDVIDIDSIEVDTSDLVDNSVKILPGVRHMIDSIPDGKWCVATSGAVSRFSVLFHSTSF
jgi:hypothetical protein